MNKLPVHTVSLSISIALLLIVMGWLLVEEIKDRHSRRK
jgi:hypothetical protein